MPEKKEKFVKPAAERLQTLKAVAGRNFNAEIAAEVAELERRQTQTERFLRKYAPALQKLLTEDVEVN